MNERSRGPGRTGRPIRPPHVAGAFYPADASRLGRVVDGLLANGIGGVSGRQASPSDEPADLSNLLGALVPHAGLRYSGAVAGAAWARIGRATVAADTVGRATVAADTVGRATVAADTNAGAAATILIAGTNHFAWLDGVGVWAGGAWETPLGAIAVDGPWTDALLSLGPPFVPAMDEHLEEHSIEVQLPLVARACPGARIVPFLVSLGDLERAIDAGRRLGARLRETIGRGERVVLVASSDLAHYPAEPIARAIDERVLEPILALDAPGLARQEEAIRTERLPGVACGMCGIEPAVFAVAALAEAGARSATLLAHATSADAPGGDPDRVVGYAAVTFSR